MSRIWAETFIIISTYCNISSSSSSLEVYLRVLLKRRWIPRSQRRLIEVYDDIETHLSLTIIGKNSIQGGFIEVVVLVIEAHRVAVRALNFLRDEIDVFEDRFPKLEHG